MKNVNIQHDPLNIKKTDTEEAKDQECSIVFTVAILGQKWNIHIISELLNGTLSFTELKTRLIDQTMEQISSRVLTDKLHKLVEIGIIYKEQRHDHRSFYNLTEKGIDSKIVFSVLKAWGIKHGGVSQKLCKNYTCIHNGVQHIEFEVLQDLMD
jgi:DNA-binding HxlR family transcriptional regulator